jgi:molybdopterin synthase sulfur carrier subunit
MIDLIYFSWIRERIGKSNERVETSASTVIELIEELKKRDVRYSEVFSDLASFRVAINQELTNFDASITEAKEIAFFPPMTGG